MAIDRATFTDAERDAFRNRLLACLDALEQLLARPGFGEGDTTIGAEVELALIDDEGRPRNDNAGVLEAADDPRLVTELNQFNLEANLSPVPLRGRPFDAIADELDEVLTRLREVAQPRGTDMAAIGIVPTVTTHDLQQDALSADIRYTALDQQLRRLRREPFQLDIAGQDHLRVSCEHVTMEGANTSLQVHLRVDPNDYARTWNAAQVASVLLLSATANSPTFLQHRLWDETRIALFKQSVDPRGTIRRGRHARVGFGQDWQFGSVVDEFRRGVEDFEPILPVLADEDPTTAAANGHVPQLLELRLHQGTVWRWNRAVYDDAEGGHLRLELRCLPSGPTPVDMVANVAAAIGLVLALRPRMDDLVTALPFQTVAASFYRCARLGPEAVIPWPGDGGLVDRPATQVLRELLPDALDALVDLGVERDDAADRLAIVDDRARTGRTGARWQRHVLAGLADHPDRWARLFARYRELAATGEPVHTWPR